MDDEEFGKPAGGCGTFLQVDYDPFLTALA
jgi:hypothetical protein